MTSSAPRPRTDKTSSSVTRGLQVLAAILEAGHVRASALADVTNIPLSSVYRHLQPLLEHGLVLDRGGGYEIGPVLRRSIAVGFSREELAAHSRPLLRFLCDRTGETALGVTRFGLHAMVFAQEESTQTDRVVYQEGTRLPLHAGAASRAILAYAPPGVWSGVLSIGLKKVTGATFDEEQLLRSLEQVRQTGIAVSREELTHGGVAVAAPVLVRGQSIAAVCVQGPTSRCGRQWQADVSPLLLACATQLGDELTAALGAEGDPSEHHHFTHHPR